MISALKIPILAALLTLLGVEGALAQLMFGNRSVQPLETFRDCDICLEMIVLPPASFMIGSKALGFAQSASYLERGWAAAHPSQRNGPDQHHTE